MPGYFGNDKSRGVLIFAPFHFLNFPCIELYRSCTHDLQSLTDPRSIGKLFRKVWRYFEVEKYKTANRVLIFCLLDVLCNILRVIVLFFKDKVFFFVSA